VNHPDVLHLSSIPPQRRRSGVSIGAVRFVGFFSFASLRRLRFERYDDTDVRAALRLHGLLLRESAGWSLRSECDPTPPRNKRSACPARVMRARSRFCSRWMTPADS